MAKHDVDKLMQDKDWKQRWPRGEQRREAIEAHLGDEQTPATAPAPLSTKTVTKAPKAKTKPKAKA